MATDHRFSTSHRSPGSQQEREIFRGDAFALYGGRIGAVSAIITFIVFYLLTLHTLGLWAGMAIGWLPCAILAWISANLVAPVSTYALRQGTHTWKAIKAHNKRTKPIH